LDSLDLPVSVLASTLDGLRFKTGERRSYRSNSRLRRPVNLRMIAIGMPSRNRMVRNELFLARIRGRLADGSTG